MEPQLYSERPNDAWVGWKMQPDKANKITWMQVAEKSVYLAVLIDAVQRMQKK